MWVNRVNGIKKGRLRDGNAPLYMVYFYSAMITFTPRSVNMRTVSVATRLSVMI